MTYSIMNNALGYCVFCSSGSAAGEDLTLHPRASVFFSYPPLLGDEMWGWGCEDRGRCVWRMMMKSQKRFMKGKGGER